MPQEPSISNNYAFVSGVHLIPIAATTASQVTQFFNSSPVVGDGTATVQIC